MSAKRTPIPKGKRLMAKARRTAKALWADVRGEPKSRGKTDAKRNPWQRCVVCHHRTPPHSISCGKPHHVGMCFGCCGYPHDDEDEDERDQDPGLVRDKDDEDKEDEAQ